MQDIGVLFLAILAIKMPVNNNVEDYTSFLTLVKGLFLVMIGPL